MSLSEPVSAIVAGRPWYRKGTRLVVWAVWLCPEDSSSICSTLPWSAVISSFPAAFVNGGRYPGQAGIDCFYSALSRRSSLPVCPTMSGLATLQMMTSYLPGVNGIDQPPGQFRRGHFRLQVIGGDIGGGDQDPVFQIERCFFSPVEEKCHVGIFLGFGNA